jgi:folate-binding protein YgfZ
MTPKIVALEDRGLISVTGDDARKFLQDLVTADIDGLEAGGAAYVGLLTPQGKVLFDFFIFRDGPGYLVDCLLDLREGIVKRLSFYRLRAKVEIKAEDGRQVLAIMEGSGTGAVPDPRTGLMGERAYDRSDSAKGGASIYHQRRIALGLAEGGHDFAEGEVFPHEANFDQIGALSFRKGCFVGQEVVSRMEHRGTTRSRILPCRLEGALPPKGSEIMAGEKIVGHACSGMNDRLLALLRLDRLEEARGRGVPVTAAGARIFPERPPWARFNLPA